MTTLSKNYFFWELYFSTWAFPEMIENFAGEKLFIATEMAAQPFLLGEE